MCQSRSRYFHLTGQESPLIRGQRVPRGKEFWTRRQYSIRGNDAEGLLTRERFLTQSIPALVEAAPIAGNPLFRNMMGLMCFTGSKIEEKRLFRSNGLLC